MVTSQAMARIKDEEPLKLEHSVCISIKECIILAANHFERNEKIDKKLGRQNNTEYRLPDDHGP